MATGYKIVAVAAGIDPLTRRKVTRYEVRAGDRVVADFSSRTRAERFVKAHREDGAT